MGPRVLPAIAYSGILNFLGALESLSIPLIIGKPVGIETFMTFIYTEGIERSQPNYGVVGAATVMQLLIIGASIYRQEKMPDILGLGVSDDAEDPALLASVGAPLIDGLDALLGKGAQLDVVAFSFGASISAAIGLACPGRIERLILVGAGGLRARRVRPRWRRKTGAKSAVRIRRWSSTTATSPTSCSALVRRSTVRRL